MNNIFVGNLSPDATEQDIRSIFEKHGSVDRFRMMTDRETGHPRGFAFVEMTDDSAAQKAIAALNGLELKGRGINVNAARPQLYRHSGNGGSRSKKQVTAVTAVEMNERQTRRSEENDDQNGSLPIQS
jgi:RNA recognition motif-containing protein